jgi:hypothetical protein
MDLKTLNFSQAEIQDLRTLSRHREWVSILKIVDEISKAYAKEVLDPKLDLNQTNAARGGHQACLRLYRWLKTLYDEAHST